MDWYEDDRASAWGSARTGWPRRPRAAPRRPRGPWARAAQARLKAYERRLTIEREILDARLRMIGTLDGRLGDRPAGLWEPAENGNGNGAMEESPGPTRREVLGEVFARMPATQFDAN